MKKTVLALDIGNVCVKIDHMNWMRCLGENEFPASLRQLLFRYECGEIKDEFLFFKAVSEIFDNRYSLDELKDAFDSILISPVVGMTDLVRKFPCMGIEAIFFSDISPTHLRRTEAVFPAFDCVKGGIFSFDSGMQKPSEAMFSRFETVYGIPDVYTDDRIELIEAACKRGWNAHLFCGAQDLEDFLSDTV